MSVQEQLSELTELAGAFIHEVKNHISTLGLNIQLLVEDLENPQNPRERKALDRTRKLQVECDKLFQFSNDFLRFARAERVRKDRCNLDDVVSELVDFLSPTAKQKNISIDWYPSGHFPEVQLDRDLFKQALLNLLINAEQAMPDGGKIVLQMRSADDSIILEVIDNGKGIPPEQLGMLFKPFFTTKREGTGLGLPTARKIIAAHGGSIEVQSEVGRGTKFSIKLPELLQEKKSG